MSEVAWTVQDTLGWGQGGNETISKVARTMSKGTMDNQKLLDLSV